MNAYLFNGLVSQYHKGQFFDASSSVILYGGDEEASRKVFEKMLLSPGCGEDPPPTKIERMVGAPVMDQLFTETGHAPIRWPELAEEAQRVLEATALDEQAQGYWVDCEQCVRPDNPASGIEWLKRELPEEIQSGLNWSVDRTFFFLISVLSPPAAASPLVEEPGDDRPFEGDQVHDPDEVAGSVDWDSPERQAAFPQLAKKELAVVVRARNSVVAAWLWRRHAASTPLARNAIRVDALCDLASPHSPR